MISNDAQIGPELVSEPGRNRTQWDSLRNSGKVRSPGIPGLCA